jgi:hypothetical protein
VSVEDLSRQLVKTALITHTQYATYCQGLADDSAVIIERPFKNGSVGEEIPFRIAVFESFDSKGGWHKVRYATGFSGSDFNGNRANIQNQDDFSRLKYDTNTTQLMLAAREYCIVHRSNSDDVKSPIDMEQLLAVNHEEETETDSANSQLIGTRVESNCAHSSSWVCYTIVSVRTEDKSKKYDLVSEDGEVFSEVPDTRIRGVGGNEDGNMVIDLDDSELGGRADRRSAEARAHLSRAFPFLTARRQLSGSDNPSGPSSRGQNSKRMLKRTWSALAPIESMCPVGIQAESSRLFPSTSTVRSWKCKIGDKAMEICIDKAFVDLPPSVSIEFSSPRHASPITISSPSETTLVGLLCKLYDSEEMEVFPKKGHQITYSVVVRPTKGANGFSSIKQAAIDKSAFAQSLTAIDMDTSTDQLTTLLDTSNRSRKLSDSAIFSDDEDVGASLTCEGLDEICIQCLEIIQYLAEVDNILDGRQRKDDKRESVFVSQGLSQKLRDQLENPLLVVGKAIPSWCVTLPTFTPQIFSYESRKLLLDRVAFGVSRSTLRQQEAKVNVGRLRQRMTALRARAVELVGEAFSGGAEDPTALQLQADELYGMEEVSVLYCIV